MSNIAHKTMYNQEDGIKDISFSEYENKWVVWELMSAERLGLENAAFPTELFWTIRNKFEKLSDANKFVNTLEEATKK